jgi:hypothetical protein
VISSPITLSASTNYLKRFDFRSKKDLTSDQNSVTLSQHPRLWVIPNRLPGRSIFPPSLLGLKAVIGAGGDFWFRVHDGSLDWNLLDGGIFLSKRR